MTHLVTILFWTLPALPIVVGVYGWRRGHKAGYDQACADYSRAKERTKRRRARCP